MPEPYGSFAWICAHAPLPACNILFRAAWDAGALTTLFPSTSDFFSPYNITSATPASHPYARAARRDAGTGLGAGCVVPRVGQRGSVGDIVVMSLFSMVVPAALIWRSFQNKLGVGALELSLVLGVGLTPSGLTGVFRPPLRPPGCHPVINAAARLGGPSRPLRRAPRRRRHARLAGPLQHHGVVGVVRVCLSRLAADSSELKTVYLVVQSVGASAIFGVTLYLALATGYGWTSAFAFVPEVRSIALFTLTFVWPAFALVATYAAMFYIAEYRMREREPALWLFGSACALAGGQVVLFVASQPLCSASNRILNGAFISALMNLLALVLFYRAWNLMGEASWSLTEAWMPRYSYASYGY
ncbi:uncharacterized protein COLE_02433 [Cutaneotrichosporon oleaginosum]|uniref:uncharacterized protein n=1 Tax=Cutaneotrichosporon oleaginosum TaxID=879819 RepID=UPI001323596A|nr:hypothetical protein COLE_02433 [Cutaneotrichosporon oleaginosum]